MTVKIYDLNEKEPLLKETVYNIASIYRYRRSSDGKEMLAISSDITIRNANDGRHFPIENTAFLLLSDDNNSKELDIMKY